MVDMKSVGDEPAPTRENLESNVLRMQNHLAGILDVVDEMKRNCSRLQSENKFIQEYIESLMIKRRSSESN
ncbi:hypothetical protein B9G98_00876 [Wickerhamiella sorbophila]|uniref:Uncharacterized protein n=1 Tax=Wickerhamiella sorbophila TaxID=45607 RepID=A0A2T0FE28_9ASCO|nr:hypothetical protein B9G98_00876 [Wickerhamiella sorbophila]PRT53256.1 hypothetical protein B9G98_00876 [Wickerhamiella sorbophila]